MLKRKGRQPAVPHEPVVSFRKVDNGDQPLSSPTYENLNSNQIIESLLNGNLDRIGDDTDWFSNAGFLPYDKTKFEFPREKLTLGLFNFFLYVFMCLLGYTFSRLTFESFKSGE